MSLQQYNRFEQAAIDIALIGPGCGGSSGHNFRLGAVLVEKNTIISSKYNSYRTHPRLLDFTQYPYLHAEQAAIFGAGWSKVQNCKGLKLWVARIQRDQKLALAKPCIVCQSILKLTNIKEVYYSTKEGTFRQMI